MNINELMIGDWVLFLINITGGDTEYDPEIAEYQPMKINTICSWEVGGEVTSNYDVINDPDELKPIPLTAEILEKYGFGNKEEKDELTHYYFGKECHCAKMDILIGTYDHVTYWFYSPEIAISEFRYVHELQHALRWCHIEKDIKI